MTFSLCHKRYTSDIIIIFMQGVGGGVGCVDAIREQGARLSL